MNYILDHWPRWTHNNVCDIETPVNRCSWQPFEYLVCVCVCVRYCVLLTCLQAKNWPFASICAIFHHLSILQTDSTWMTQRFCHRNCCSQSRRQRLDSSNFHPGLGQKLGVSCLETTLGNDSHSSGCWDIYFPIGMSQKCDKKSASQNRRVVVE